jgi:hypothetical protein
MAMGATASVLRMKVSTFLPAASAISTGGVCLK